jgi:hypothetical protein
MRATRRYLATVTAIVLAGTSTLALAQSSGSSGGAAGGAAGGSAGTAAAPGSPGPGTGTPGPTNPGQQNTGNAMAPTPGSPSPLPPQMQTQSSQLPSQAAPGATGSTAGGTRPGCLPSASNSSGAMAPSTPGTVAGTGTPRIANDPTLGTSQSGSNAAGAPGSATRC